MIVVSDVLSMLTTGSPTEIVNVVGELKANEIKIEKVTLSRIPQPRRDTINGQCHHFAQRLGFFPILVFQ